MSDVGWSGWGEKKNTEKNEHVQRHTETVLR